MIDTAEIVAAIESAKNQGFEVLVFVAPINPVTLALSELSKETIEDRVQTALIAELNRCLVAATTCGVTIPGIGPCTVKGKHEIHERGAVKWNGGIH